MEYCEYETWTFEQWETLPLTDDDLIYHVLDSVTSAFASWSLHEIEENDPGLSSINSQGHVILYMMHKGRGCSDYGRLPRLSVGSSNLSSCGSRDQVSLLTKKRENSLVLK
jgi:hypothetical protein